MQRVLAIVAIMITGLFSNVAIAKPTTLLKPIYERLAAMKTMRQALEAINPILTSADIEYFQSEILRHTDAPTPNLTLKEDRIEVQADHGIVELRLDPEKADGSLLVNNQPWRFDITRSAKEQIDEINSRISIQRNTVSRLLLSEAYAIAPALAAAYVYVGGAVAKASACLYVNRDNKELYLNGEEDKERHRQYSDSVIAFLNGTTCALVGVAWPIADVVQVSKWASGKLHLQAGVDALKAGTVITERKLLGDWDWRTDSFKCPNTPVQKVAVPLQHRADGRKANFSDSPDFELTLKNKQGQLIRYAAWMSFHGRTDTVWKITVSVAEPRRRFRPVRHIVLNSKSEIKETFDATQNGDYRNLGAPVIPDAADRATAISVQKAYENTCSSPANIAKARELLTKNRYTATAPIVGETGKASTSRPAK